MDEDLSLKSGNLLTNGEDLEKMDNRNLISA